MRVYMARVTYRNAHRKARRTAFTEHDEAPLSGERSSVGVEDADFTEKRSLRFDFGAVADNHNARVRRIEIAARGEQDIFRGERANCFAKGFEIIFRQMVQINGGKLAEQAILRGDAERKRAAQVIGGVFQFIFADGKRAHAVELVENFRERSRDDFVAHRGADGKVSGVAQRGNAAVRAVSVALLLANVGDEARIESAAVNRVGEHGAMPVRAPAIEREIADADFGLHRAGQMNKIHAAALGCRRSRNRKRMRRSGFPLVKSCFDELQHFGAGKIADGDQKRVGRNVVFAVERDESFDGVRFELRFGGSNDCVRAVAEEDAAKAFAREKAGGGALDFQFFEPLAALAIELFGRKGSVLREVGDHLQNFRREFGKAGDGYGAGIRAGGGGEAGTHAAQVFFNLAALARNCAGANDASGEFSDLRSGFRDAGVAGTEKQFDADFGKSARFGKNDLHAVGKRAHGARGPGDRAFRAERRRSGRKCGLRGSGVHCAPFFELSRLSRQIIGDSLMAKVRSRRALRNRTANQDGAAFAREIFLGGGLNLCRSDGKERIKNRVDAARIVIEKSEAGKRVHQTEARGGGASGFEGGIKIGAQLYFDLVKFVFGDAMLAHAANHFIERGNSGVGGIFRLVKDGGGEEGWSAVTDGVPGIAGAGLESNLFFENEGMIDAPGASAVENAVEDHDGVPIAVFATRREVTDGHGGNLAEFFLDFAAALFALGRLGNVGSGKPRLARNVIEEAARQGKRVALIDITDDDEHGVVGRVVGVEKSANVGEGSGVEVGEIAVKIVSVGPIAKCNRRQIEPGKTAVRAIENIHANFFFDHVALIAEIFVVNFESTHAVGFEPEDAFEGVGGNNFEIVGEVVIRGAVQNAAGGVDEANVFHFPGVLGALKHHVLEEMGEATASARLEAKADLIIDAHGGDGRGMVGRNDDAQAICERFGEDGNLGMRQSSSLAAIQPLRKTRSSSCRVFSGCAASRRAERRASAA